MKHASSCRSRKSAVDHVSLTVCSVQVPISEELMLCLPSIYLEVQTLFKPLNKFGT